HDLCAGDDRRWRLANERLVDAGLKTVRWRNVLSTGGPIWSAWLQESARTDCGCLEARSRQDRRARRKDRRGAARISISRKDRRPNRRGNFRRRLAAD